MANIAIDKAIEAAADLVREAHAKNKLPELTKAIVRRQVEAKLGLDGQALDEKPYKKRISEAVESTVEQLKPQKNTDDDKGKTLKEENANAAKPSSSGKKRKTVDTEVQQTKKTKPKDGVSKEKASKRTSTGKKQKEKAAVEDKTSKKDKSKSSADRKSSPSGEERGSFKSMAVIVSDDEDDDTRKDPPASTPSARKKGKRTMISETEDEAETSRSPKRHRKSEEHSSRSKGKLDMGETKQSSVEDAKDRKNDTEPKSDSELSVLLDDPPSKKKKASKKAKRPKGEPEKKSRSKKDSRELSADDEQIKKLKSLVVACGVRKIWSKELKDCETPSSQISHLRKLLTELGMKGRLSLEQAKAIKAKRDLEKEMADVQEFAQRYAGDRPKRSTQKPLVDASSDEQDDDANSSHRPKNALRSIMDFLGDQSDSD